MEPWACAALGSGCSCLGCFCFWFQPPQFKLDPRLARLLGIHTQTRPVIIQALWQYIKTHKLQDPHEREFVICDKYLQQVTAWLQPASPWHSSALAPLSSASFPYPSLSVPDF